jgi:AcrR family transcriptional regulator
MEKTRREQKREDTINEIKAIARHLMSEGGTTTLSMRPIAAEMRMSVMGLYRYFENRDALLTALIADNFNAMADAMENARDSERSDDPVQKLLAVLIAYRSWAIEHPVDFQLNYGNPIPGYEAPPEITVPAVVRSFVVAIGLIEEILQRGLAIPPPHYDHVPPPLEAGIGTALERYGYPVSPLALYFAVTGWSQLHGVIMLELFNHIQPLIEDSTAYYEAQVHNLLYNMGVKLP